MSGCKNSINYSSTVTRHSYTMSLILLTGLAIAFSLSSFTLSSVTGFPTVRFWWLPTLSSLLAKTQLPIPPTWLGSCLLYWVGNILKEDNIGWTKPIVSQLLCSSDSSVFSKVYPLVGFSAMIHRLVNLPHLPDILCCTDIFSISSCIFLEIILPFARMWCWIQASCQAVSGLTPLWCVLIQ